MSDLKIQLFLIVYVQISFYSLCHWYGADFRCLGINEDGTTCPSLSGTVYTHYQLAYCLEAQRDEEVLERKQLPGRLDVWSILVLIPWSVCSSKYHNLIFASFNVGYLLEQIRKNSLYSQKILVQQLRWQNKASGR